MGCGEGGLEGGNLIANLLGGGETGGVLVGEI